MNFSRCLRAAWQRHINAFLAALGFQLGQGKNALALFQSTFQGNLDLITSFANQRPFFRAQPAHPPQNAGQTSFPTEVLAMPGPSLFSRAGTGQSSRSLLLDLIQLL
jgi:hypothetical protein